ncbi:MAG: NAD-dependent epimerase/dehydratase family protein [Proteobacteria bacterium]|nr:NAD-dependent epimerase/dehydratase family protein [Pseudomonadota bacterium]MDA1331210.1 NAD-dependent epimerase/dehydratase family protein [Pseudomonadota bacterium]
MIDLFSINKADFSEPVVVTGAGGCIGSWVLHLLQRAGVSVIALDLRKDTRRPSLLMTKEELNSISWLEGDISEPKTITHAVEQHKAGAIIHLAALQVPFCRADPILGAQVNVVGTINVLEAARHFGIKRLAYASSVAAYGVFDPDTLSTLYGAYKYCNEETAKVYMQDWGVPSTCLRPGVVYGIGRDQGMTSKTTFAILAAAMKQPYTVPFIGPLSWLHAGEVASAFIKSVSQPRNEARVFDINGATATVEEGINILKKIEPKAEISLEGAALPFPSNLSDEPLRAYLGDYGSVDLVRGIQHTYDNFCQLVTSGKIGPDAFA